MTNDAGDHDLPMLGIVADTRMFEKQLAMLRTMVDELAVSDSDHPDHDRRSSDDHG